MCFKLLVQFLEVFFVDFLDETLEECIGDRCYCREGGMEVKPKILIDREVVFYF
jgi:hypothetical protein